VFRSCQYQDLGNTLSNRSASTYDSATEAQCDGSVWLTGHAAAFPWWRFTGLYATNNARDMDVRTVLMQGFVRKRDGLFKERPAVYILILLGVCVAAGLYQIRADSIFSCQALGYTSDRYLAYCHATGYGDYEHGVFWFGLEPGTDMAAASADVLFLGDSRLQFAFSTAATAQWFSSALARYYLLGFVAFENSIFARELLHKLKPRAKVYVINLDDFFESSERPVAKTVMHDGAARSRYKVKRFLQILHQAICMKLTKICGHGVVFFRSRQTGAWYVPQTDKFKGLERPVSYNEQINEHAVEEAIAIGRIFLSELPVKTECVILTVVPSVGTKLNVANVIASGLGKPLVVPEHLDGLQTRDGVHLDDASAERWSEAFYRTAGSQIHKCLEASSHGGNRHQSAS